MENVLQLRRSCGHKWILVDKGEDSISGILAPSCLKLKKMNYIENGQHPWRIAENWKDVIFDSH